MIANIHKLFPNFASLVNAFHVENVLPPATDSEIAEIEGQLQIPLPDTYKGLLRCARGFWLIGGAVQFGTQHPFFHDFRSFDELTPLQRNTLALKGGQWPPPTDGMLCFAEFFMEADGDQVLFDVSNGLIRGEYPIMYYSHEECPPSVRKLADSFGEFMETFLEYPAFAQED